MYILPTLSDVKEGQLEQLARYHGGEPGVLNEGRVDSALHSASFGFDDEYAYGDVAGVAAAQLKFLALGHGFANGNKRVALGTALETMHMNGLRVQADWQEMAQIVLDLIEHTIDQPQVAQFFREHSELFSTTSGEEASEDERRGLLRDARAWAHATYALAFAKLAE